MTPSASDRVLYVGAYLYSTQQPDASAMLVEDGTVAWIGPDDSARALHGDVPTLDVQGSLITPGFVDVLPVLTADEPSAEERGEAARRGVVALVPGPAGMRDGVLAVAPCIQTDAALLTLSGSGTPLAFGSGAPEHQEPWSWGRAAAHDAPTEERISDRAAFLAASRGGQRLAGVPHPGALNPGAPATFVVWEPWDLTVRGNDARIQTWSTDPRSRTPLLPDLTEGAPRALRTVIDGAIVHDALAAP